MSMYDADDVATALNTLIINVMAPVIATHPDQEAIYDRFLAACAEAKGHSDPAVSLARTVLENLLDAIDREIAEMPDED